VLVGLMPVAGLAAAVVLGRQPLTLVAAGGALLAAAGCALGLAQPPRAMRSTSSASSS
jgi:hypothetical protein